MTKLRNLRIFCLALLLWIAPHTRSLAFYNATSGRWLSRDPIGEKGALNVYCFAVNNSLVSSDAVGLSIQDWHWNNGGDGELRGPPYQDGGTQVTLWEVLAVVRPSLDIPGVWELNTRGEGALRWWYVNNRTRDHEKNHIKIWTDTWAKLRDDAVSYETQWCNKRIPDCLKQVIESTMKNAYQLLGKWQNADFDCNDYPAGQPRDQKCAEAASTKRAYEATLKEMQKQIEHCFQL